MHQVVVGEPDRQHLHDGFGIRCRIEANVVAFEGLHERLRHTVALRRTDWLAAGLQADVLSKAKRVSSDVSGAVVAQPFGGARQLRSVTKAITHRLNHDVAHQLAADTAGGRRKSNYLPIAAKFWGRSTASSRTR